MPDNENQNTLKGVLFAALLAILAGGTSPWWWVEIKESFFSNNKIIHDITDQVSNASLNSINVGDEWSDFTTRAWVKFENQNKSISTVLIDLDWNEAKTKPFQYSKSTSIKFSANGENYNLELGEYDPSKNSISVAVFPLN